MLKVFYDFEFTRIHMGTTPISLGIITEDGKKSFYAEFTDYDKSQVDDWLVNNVFNRLSLTDEPEEYLHIKEGVTTIKGTVPYVVGTTGGLYEWLTEIEKPVMMASYGNGYDFVLLGEIFKIAKTGLPENLFPWGYDVQTLFFDSGYDTKDKEIKEKYVEINNRGDKHNALFDADVARKIYLKLKSNACQCTETISNGI